MRRLLPVARERVRYRPTKVLIMQLCHTYTRLGTVLNCPAALPHLLYSYTVLPPQ